MLHRFSLLLAILVALLFGRVGAVQAQCPANSCSLGFTSSVTVQSLLSCTVTRAAMNFGSHFKSEGVASLDETTSGEARCVIDPSNGIVDVSFTLPSVLTRTGGTETLPITFGVESLRLRDCDCTGSVVQGRNPAVPSSFTVTSGFLHASLGQNGPNDPAGEVSVNLSGATAAGTYTGVITAQIALR